MFSKNRLLSLSTATLQGAKFTPRMFYHYSVKPLQEFAQDYQHVGRLFKNNDTTKHYGSGVYINGLVITAAHCLPPSIDDKCYFSLQNYTPVKITHVIRHPQFKKCSFFDTLLFESKEEKIENIHPTNFDIAVGLLEEKFPITICEPNIEYSPKDITDCISVGYPGQYEIRNEDEMRLLVKHKYTAFPWEIAKPMGVMASCYSSSRFSYCLEHKIGYQKGSEPVKYTVLDSGTAPGMSGGGLFTRKDQKLIGIHVGRTGTEKGKYSMKRGDNNLFVLFSKHQAFLENTMNELKNTRKR